jgi:hydroxymethylbilane synthase
MSESSASQRVVVATRKSALALAQCRAWIRELVSRHDGLEVEELHVTTSGDRILDRSLAEIGGKGLFVKEIEEAILEGKADLAVHSLKDVPAELMSELTLGCFPQRADPRDVVITQSGVSFFDLPSGAKVGTSSLRRVVQLRENRPDLEFLPIRGNVDTRLKKCETGVVDAVVLARAGLARLGLGGHPMEILEPEVCLPAVGQGALVVEQRQGDTRVARMLAPLEDLETRIGVQAERGVMLAVEGNCQVPVAAYAQREGGEIRLRGFLADADGGNVRRGEERARWPESENEALEFGQALGAKLKR